MNFQSQFTDAEKVEIHDARIVELVAGQISGREFVDSMRMQLGYSEFAAKSYWHKIKSENECAIYKVKTGADVSAPVQGKFFPAKIICFYASDVGAVVKLENSGAQVPFALYELRVG